MQFLDPKKESFSTIESSFDKAFKMTNDFGKEIEDFEKDINEVNKNYNELPPLELNFGSSHLKTGDYVTIKFKGKSGSIPNKNRFKPLKKYKDNVGKVVDIGSGWFRVNLKNGNTVGFRSYELEKVSDYKGPEISSSFKPTSYERKGLNVGDLVKVKIDNEIFTTKIKELTGNNRYKVEIEGTEHTVGRANITSIKARTSSLYDTAQRAYEELAIYGSKDLISPFMLMKKTEQDFFKANGSKPSESELKENAMRVICESVKKPRQVLTCREDQEISDKTGQCVKRCNDEQIRNPTSNRCVNAHGSLGKKLSTKLGIFMKKRRKSKKSKKLSKLVSSIIVDDEDTPAVKPSNLEFEDFDWREMESEASESESDESDESEASEASEAYKTPSSSRKIKTPESESESEASDDDEDIDADDLLAYGSKRSKRSQRMSNKRTKRRFSNKVGRRAATKRMSKKRRTKRKSN